MTQQRKSALPAQKKDPVRGRGSLDVENGRARKGLTEAERGWLLEQMGQVLTAAPAEVRPPKESEPPRVPAQAPAARRQARVTSPAAAETEPPRETPAPGAGEYRVVFACGVSRKDSGDR